jgi:hypothetical protein
VFTAPNASSTLVVLTILLYLPYSKMYILVDQAHIYDLTVSFLYVSIKNEIHSDNKTYLARLQRQDATEPLLPGRSRESGSGGPPRSRERDGSDLRPQPLPKAAGGVGAPRRIPSRGVPSPGWRGGGSSGVTAALAIAGGRRGGGGRTALLARGGSTTLACGGDGRSCDAGAWPRSGGGSHRADP